MPVVKLTIPKHLHTQTQAITTHCGYLNRQELILEALREHLKRKQLELLALQKGAGQTNSIDREAVINAYEKSQRDLLTELNLTLHEPSQN
ncbi:MAG: hypothetical protein ACMXYD_00305 [Candidatus Woesearchaeota archaeon]